MELMHTDVGERIREPKACQHGLVGKSSYTGKGCHRSAPGETLARCEEQRRDYTEAAPHWSRRNNESSNSTDSTF